MKDIKINEKVLNTVKNVIVYVLLAAQIGLFAYHLFLGFGVAFGQRVTVFYAVNLLLSFSDIGAASALKIIGGTILAIVYFVYTVRMIKAILNSVQWIKPALKNIELNSQVSNAVSNIPENLGKITVLNMAFLVFTRMVGPYRIPSGVIAILVISAILSIAGRFVVILIKEGDLFNTIYNVVVCTGIYLTSLVLFLASISTTSFKSTFGFLDALVTLAEHSDGLPSWMMLLDQFAVNNVLLLIMQFMVLNIIYDSLSYSSYRVVDPYSVRTLFIFSIVTAASHVFISVLVANEMGFDLVPAIVNAVKHFASTVAFAGVAYFSFKFPSKFELPKAPEASAEAAPENAAENTEAASGITIDG